MTIGLSLGIGGILGFAVGQLYEQSYSKSIERNIRASYEWQLKELKERLRFK